MNSFVKKHTMHVGAERPDSSGLSFGRHTCFVLIPACLSFGRLIPQVLNPSLLASSQTRWAPLSLLPDIHMIFLFFMINPPVISMPFAWLIINSIYF
jgi:hypothetical protein